MKTPAKKPPAKRTPPRGREVSGRKPLALPEVPETRFPRLEKWSCTQRSPFADPAIPGNLLLQGDVYGHPDARFKDGEHIVTSAVTSFQGRFITTESRTYYVGEADVGWIKWLKEQGRTFYPDNPLQWTSNTIVGKAEGKAVPRRRKKA